MTHTKWREIALAGGGPMADMYAAWTADIERLVNRAVRAEDDAEQLINKGSREA